MGQRKTTKQPAHIKKVHGYLTHRDAIWAAIRELRTDFTTRDIEHHCGVEHATIKCLIQGLDKAGYLKVTGQKGPANKLGQTRAINAYTCNLYTLIKDVGVHTPNINKHGEVITMGNGREQLWKTMKLLKEFTLNDLVIHASTDKIPVAENTAKEYLLFLRRGKYIVIAKKGNSNTTVYRYIRNTGPRPPIIQRSKQVFDPNTREVVWQRPEGDPLDTPVCLNIGDDA